jgi:hypothetical protein
MRSRGSCEPVCFFFATLFYCFIPARVQTAALAEKRPGYHRCSHGSSAVQYSILFFFVYLSTTSRALHSPGEDCRWREPRPCPARPAFHCWSISELPKAMPPDLGVIRALQPVHNKRGSSAGIAHPCASRSATWTGAASFCIRRMHSRQWTS